MKSVAAAARTPVLTLGRMAPWLELPFDIEKVTPEEEKLIRKCLMGA